jgi:ATP-binding cassette subfamily B protein
MTRVLTPPGRRPLVATAALGVVVLGGIVLVVREATAGHLGAGAAATYVQTFMVALGGIQQSSWTGLQTRARDGDAQAVRPGDGGGRTRG